MEYDRSRLRRRLAAEIGSSSEAALDERLEMGPSGRSSAFMHSVATYMDRQWNTKILRRIKKVHAKKPLEPLYVACDLHADAIYILDTAKIKEMRKVKPWDRIIKEGLRLMGDLDPAHEVVVQITDTSQVGRTACPGSILKVLPMRKILSFASKDM